MKPEMIAMKKMLFILNPKAGQKRAKRYLTDILSVFNRGEYEVSVFVTGKQGDATEMAQLKAPEVDLVACCGGDGTFNETVTGILRSGAEVELGYIPAGTTNDFANGLKLPTNVMEAARTIVSGTPKCYDVGQFGDRYFSYVASFGAFTRASYTTPQGLKNALGHTAYLLSGIQELSQIRKSHLRFELDDGQVVEDDFLFGAICNSTSLGGILTLDPKQVDMCDGKFELMLIRAPKSLVELADCLRALQTQKYNCKMITFVTASAVTVTADPEMEWSLDGERETGHEKVEIRNLHHAIRLKQKG